MWFVRVFLCGYVRPRSPVLSVNSYTQLRPTQSPGDVCSPEHYENTSGQMDLAVLLFVAGAVCVFGVACHAVPRLALCLDVM